MSRPDHLIYLNPIRHPLTFREYLTCLFLITDCLLVGLFWISIH